MKKIYFVLLAGILLFNSCAVGNQVKETPAADNNTSVNGGQTSGVGGLLGNIVGALTGNSNVISEKTFAGEWNYTGASCVLESEDILSQIGGAYAAKQLEDKMNEHLAKIGVKPGICSFVFAEDKTCAFKYGAHQIAGTYSVNPSTKQIIFSFLYGQMTVTADFTFSGNSLNIVFDADKLLALVKKTATATGNSAATSSVGATVGVVSKLLESFDGLKLGMKLSK